MRSILVAMVARFGGALKPGWLPAVTSRSPGSGMSRALGEPAAVPAGATGCRCGAVAGPGPGGGAGSGARTQSPEPSRERGAAAPARLSSALQVCGRGSPPLPAGPGHSQGIAGAGDQGRASTAIPLPLRRGAAGVGSVQGTKSTEHTLRRTSPTSATSSVLHLRPSQPCPGELRARLDGSCPMAPLATPVLHQDLLALLLLLVWLLLIPSCLIFHWGSSYFTLADDSSH